MLGDRNHHKLHGYTWLNDNVLENSGELDNKKHAHDEVCIEMIKSHF